MSESTDHIENLICKSVSGNCTPEENQKVEIWKAASKSNLALYNQTLKAWKQSNLSLTESEIQEDKLAIQYEINKQLQQRIQKSNRRIFLYKLVAIFALPIALVISWYIIQNPQNNVQENQICEITSPKGNVSKCVLPDGTEVWINTGSTITYNTNNFNQEIREVKLDGEAYFQVSGNKQKPFSVATKFGNINVTGTEFNVKSYSDSYRLETVLAEGSIELQINSNISQVVKIEPGERAVYKSRKNILNITKVDAEMFSSWRNGEIIFKDATLNDLIQELERIYDIQFLLDNEKIGEFRFRGMFSYNTNLIDALEKIKKTAQLDYYIENKEVRLTKK